MKIITKHYGNTQEGDKKYLVYLMNNYQPVSCTDVIGDKAKLTIQHDIMTKYGDDIEEVEERTLAQFIDENNLSITKEGNPLILVFYLDRELMGQPEIIQPFSESINNVLTQRDANAMAFFVPTDSTSERIECINPKVIDEETQLKINKLVSDIETNFDIGVKEDEIKITTMSDDDVNFDE